MHLFLVCAGLYTLSFPRGPAKCLHLKFFLLMVEFPVKPCGEMRDKYLPVDLG